jgi:hypothetical protein
MGKVCIKSGCVRELTNELHDDPKNCLDGCKNMVEKAIFADFFACSSNTWRKDVTPEKYFACRNECPTSSKDNRVEKVWGDDDAYLCHTDGASLWKIQCSELWIEKCNGANNDNDNNEEGVSEKKTSSSATTETTTTGINPTTIAIIGAVATLVVTVGYLVVREMGSNSGYKRRSLTRNGRGKTRV